MTSKWFTALFFIIFTAVWGQERAHDRWQCAEKWLGEGRMLCVCNTTFCDVIDPVPQLDVQQYVQYVSDLAGLRFYQTIGYFSDSRYSKFGLVFNIDENKTYQTILGFGASITDAVGINVHSLSTHAQDNLLKSYFSTDGIEINMIRVPIGGCDFSTHPYAYDDVEGDTELKHFNLTTEDYQIKIPVLKRSLALSQRPVHLFAAAWSSPPWMKTNNAYTGLSMLLPRYYQTWADYHIKFLDAYARQGLTFWSISTGSEPLNGFAATVTFNSLGWTASQQLRWVRDHLGPTLRASSHPDVKIHTADDLRHALPWWIAEMELNSQGAQYVDGLATHWYSDALVPPSVLDQAHQKFPDKFLLMTEASTGLFSPISVDLGSWERGEQYMESILQHVNHWNIGWVDWNLALDTTGGPNWVNNFVDSPIIVNAESDEFYKQPMFYALGHFSKFVPEGSVRVDMAVSHPGRVLSAAFRTPDGRTVVVLYNKNGFEKKVSIRGPNRGYINVKLGRRSFNTIIYE